MLRIEGLTVRAGDRLLVSNLSLDLSDGGITCLIGPSGCGKTTVLKALAGVLPTGFEGVFKTTIDGEVANLPHPDIAYQPQQDTLFPWLTIAENAALGLRVAGLSASACRAHVLPLLPGFGLQGCEDRFPHELSGGMRQRVAFLRTIVQDTRFVLLDEPFSALDAVTRLAIQDWLVQRLAEIRRGVLLVTHDLYEATRLADRILVMTAGGAIASDISLELAHRDRTEAVLAPIRSRLKALLLENSR